MQSVDITSSITQLKKEQSIGQHALMLSESVHETILFIRKQLGFDQHPLRAIIEEFKSVFVAQNMVLLCKQIDEQSREVLADVPFENKLNYVQKALESFINVIVGATAVFYSLEDLVKPSKLSRELFVNMVTNLVLEGEVYFLLFNLTSSWMEVPLQRLQKVMSNLAILENELPINKLNIHPEMQFDVNVRNKYKRTADETGQVPLTSEPVGEPYAAVKAEMLQISRLESPMSKLEWVYTCCTQGIPMEVSDFWKGYDIPAKKLSIDTDQLQGILIYVVSRMKYPQILSEVHIV